MIRCNKISYNNDLKIQKTGGIPWTSLNEEDI